MTNDQAAKRETEGGELVSEEPTRDVCQEGSPSNVLVSLPPYVASWCIGSFPSLKAGGMIADCWLVGMNSAGSLPG